MANLAWNMPEGVEPGLEESSFHDPTNFTFPFGAHICTVEVDPDTGEVKILRYVAVDDVGVVVNPMIVDGQVHGGVAQGIGQALYEHAIYDEGGPAHHRQHDGLRRAEYDPDSHHRDGAHRDALPAQPDGHQGCRRDRNHRRQPGGCQRGGGCALAAGHQAHRYAADARARLEGDAGREERWKLQCSSGQPGQPGQ